MRLVKLNVRMSIILQVRVNFHPMNQGCAQVFKSGGYVNGFKSPKLVIFNFYAPIMPRRSFVDTTYIRTYIRMCCVKQLASLFIHVDISVLISEFVVVAVLSEWWLVPTTADHCGNNADQFKISPKLFLSHIHI